MEHGKIKRRNAYKASVIPLILVLVVIVGSLILAYLNRVIATDISNEAIRDRARAVAVALDSELVLQADEGEPQARDGVLNRLRQIKSSNNDIDRAYVVVLRSTGVYYLADSDSRNFEDKMAGDSTSYVKAIFSDASVIENKFTSFENVDYVSGYAPIIDYSDGDTVAVVGISVSAGTYYQAINAAVVAPLAVGVVLLAFVIAFEIVRWRERRHVQMRSELISVASHELRTPIVGLRWAVELLQKKPMDDVQGQVVSRIYSTVVGMQSAVEDVLQLSSINSQKLTISRNSLGDLVREACASQQLAAAQKGVQLVLGDNVLSDINISCDSGKVKRALCNLISNAVKYSPENGEVEINYNNDGKNHVIEVVDHGIGIPESEQKLIFGGFYRASNAKKTGIAGTGLGLYLAHSIVKHHKGEITLATSEGRGTTFRIQLPMRKK